MAKKNDIRRLKGIVARLTKPGEATESESPPQARTETRDVPIATLQQIQDSLEVIRASAIVVAHALQEQSCEVDNDAATVLTRHVSDALTREMIQLGLLIAGFES
jgi:hypothetical protein